MTQSRLLSVASAALILCVTFSDPSAFLDAQQGPQREGRGAQAESELNAGLRAYQAGRLSEAITKLKRALVLSPSHPQIRLYLGLFLYEQDKDSAEAQGYMESVVEKFPGHSDLLLRLLDSYLRTRNEGKSEALVKKLKERMSSDSRFAFNVIYTLIHHGQFSTARKEIEELSNTLQGEVLFIGGLVELGSDENTKALALLEGADRHGFPPRQSRQMMTLADSYFRLRAFPQAARAYEAFLAHHSDVTPEQRFRLGMSYYGYGDFGRALGQMQRVKQEAPETPEIAFYLGSILIELKKPEEARPFLMTELRKDPASYKSMTKIAYIEYLSGQDSSCRQWLDKSLAQNQRWFESHLVYGLLHNRLGEYAEAVKSLEACIREEPEFPKAYFQLSQAYRRLGDEEKASRNLEHFNKLQEAAISRTQKALGLEDKPPQQ